MTDGIGLPRGVEPVLYRELEDSHKELVRVAIKKHRVVKLRKDYNLPRSHFAVGAAILPVGYSGGELPAGFNQEELSGENSRHAECTAITRMRDIEEADYKKINVIAVALDAKVPSPCGNCSQLIWDNSDGLADVLMVDTSRINKRIKSLGGTGTRTIYMSVAEDMLMENLVKVYRSEISTLLPRIDKEIKYGEIPKEHRKVVDAVTEGSLAAILLKDRDEIIETEKSPYREYQSLRPSALANLIDMLGKNPPRIVAVASRNSYEEFRDGKVKETDVNGDTRHMIRKRWSSVPVYCIDKFDKIFTANSDGALPFFPTINR